MYRNGIVEWTTPLTNDNRKTHPTVQLFKRLLYGPEMRSQREGSELGAAYREFAGKMPLGTVGEALSGMGGSFDPYAKSIIRESSLGFLKGSSAAIDAVSKAKFEGRGVLKDLKALIIDKTIESDEFNERLKARSTRVASGFAAPIEHLPYYGSPQAQSGREFVASIPGRAEGMLSSATAMTQSKFSDVLRLLNLKQREDERKKENKKGKK